MIPSKESASRGHTWISPDRIFETLIEHVPGGVDLSWVEVRGGDYLSALVTVEPFGCMDQAWQRHLALLREHRVLPDPR